MTLFISRFKAVSIRREVQYSVIFQLLAHTVVSMAISISLFISRSKITRIIYTLLGPGLGKVSLDFTKLSCETETLRSCRNGIAQFTL